MSIPYTPRRRRPHPIRRGCASRKAPDLATLARLDYLATLCLKLLRHVDDRVALRLLRETHNETFDQGSHKTTYDWKAYATRTLELRKSLTSKLKPNDDKNPPGGN